MTTNEPTKFQETWTTVAEFMPYLMFGWCLELDQPEWRIILFPIAIITAVIFVVPSLLFMGLDVIVNGEFYD